MNFKNIQKPKTQKEQIALMWDFLFNHLYHRMKFQDIKINFILAFLALILTLLGIVIVKML